MSIENGRSRLDGNNEQDIVGSNMLDDALAQTRQSQAELVSSQIVESGEIPSDVLGKLEFVKKIGRLIVVKARSDEISPEDSLLAESTQRDFDPAA